MEIYLLLVVIILLIISISRWKVHPFLALLVFGLLYSVASGIGPVESVGLLMEGFAKTLQWIAVIMIFGAMIGEIANETGGAERIAHATLKVAGKKRLPAAMGVTGYIMTGGLLWAVFYCRKIELDYDRELQEQYGSSNHNELAVPTFGATVLSLLPIFVPLILIAIRSFIGDDQKGMLFDVFRFLGTPFVALFIGVLLALLQYGKNLRMEKVAKVTERSIEKAALVIMITGAGGAFGHVIRESGVTNTISAYAADAGSIGFLFPFVLASIFTTTTGSITVSMITTASIVAPLTPALGVSPEMTAALIGSGAFCVFHVNSSFFWLLNRLHKVPAGILLKTFTLQSLFMGLFGLLAVISLRIFGLK